MRLTCSSSHCPMVAFLASSCSCCLMTVVLMKTVWKFYAPTSLKRYRLLELSRCQGTHSLLWKDASDKPTWILVMCTLVLKQTSIVGCCMDDGFVGLEIDTKSLHHCQVRLHLVLNPKGRTLLPLQSIATTPVPLTASHGRFLHTNRDVNANIEV